MKPLWSQLFANCKSHFVLVAWPVFHQISQVPLSSLLRVFRCAISVSQYSVISSETFSLLHLIVGALQYVNVPKTDEEKKVFFLSQLDVKDSTTKLLLAFMLDIILLPYKLVRNPDSESDWHRLLYNSTQQQLILPSFQSSKVGLCPGASIPP